MESVRFLGSAPRLLEAEEAKRVYTVYGKVRLTDSVWTVVSPDRAGDCNFFKVSVRMKAQDASPMPK